MIDLDYIYFFIVKGGNYMINFGMINFQNRTDRSRANRKNFSEERKDLKNVKNYINLRGKGIQIKGKKVVNFLSVISISSIILVSGMGRVYAQVRRQMTMREILSTYPYHRAGTVTLNGQTYQNASYLDVYGDLVYPYFCSNVGGNKRNGEYLWDVDETIINYQPRAYSLVSIQGRCADNSRTINAGRIAGFADQVNEGPKISLFEASRDTIQLGETVQLTWSMDNIRVIGNFTLALLVGGELGNLRIPASGQMTVRPPRRGVITYVLVGWGDKNGQTEQVERAIRITVR